jgi:hypothetical protein
MIDEDSQATKKDLSAGCTSSRVAVPVAMIDERRGGSQHHHQSTRRQQEAPPQQQQHRARTRGEGGAAHQEAKHDTVKNSTAVVGTDGDEPLAFKIVEEVNSLSLSRHGGQERLGPACCLRTGIWLVNIPSFLHRCRPIDVACHHQSQLPLDTPRVQRRRH